MFPVPGKKITTKYGIKGKHWKACGHHTGVDIAAPLGTKIVAARPGVVKHVNYGPAFGRHQYIVLSTSGKTADFYAHTRTRPANGKKVKAGDYLAQMGKEGNATGSHLHLERHNTRGGWLRWSCSKIQNPAKSIAYRKK